MRIKTSREKRLLYFKTALRWMLYYALIVLCFCIMTAGTWLKPVLLVPVAIAIAVDNNQYAAVFTGAFCGLLLDIACGRLFGYNAVLLAIFCAGVSLLYEFFLRKRLLNYLWITALVSYLQCRLDYEFYYKIWGYADVENIFVHVTLRVWVYTVISSLFVYLIISIINRFLMPKTHFSIEEVIRLNSNA